MKVRLQYISSRPWGSTNSLLSKNKETRDFTTSLQSKLLVKSTQQKPGHYLSLSKYMFHRWCIVGVVTRRYVERPRKLSSFSGKHKKISFSKVSKKKNRRVAHKASPLMGPSGTYIEITYREVTLTTQIRLVQKLRNSGAVPSIPLMPSWCAQGHLSFYLYLAQLWIPFCLSNIEIYTCL